MTPARLTEWRKERSMTIKAASEALGVGRNEWSRYERGLAPVPLTLQWAITGHALARMPIK